MKVIYLMQQPGTRTLRGTCRETIGKRELMKAWDRYADAYNKLSEEMQRAGINTDLLRNVLKTYNQLPDKVRE